MDFDLIPMEVYPLALGHAGAFAMDAPGRGVAAPSPVDQGLASPLDRW